MPRSVKVLWPCEAIAHVTDKRVRVWIHSPSIFLIAIPAYVLFIALITALWAEGGKALIVVPLTFMREQLWAWPLVLVIWFMRFTTVSVDATEVVIRHYTGIRVWEERHPNASFTFPHSYNNQDERNWDGGDFEELAHLVVTPEKAILTRRIRNALEFIEWIDEQAQRLEGKRP